MKTRSRTAAILLFPEVELLDVAGPMQVLSVAGRHYNFRPFKLRTVAQAHGAIDTRNQLRIEADATFSDMPAPELLVVPGGYGARRALDHPELMDWLATAACSAELIVTTGYGALLLAKAGHCAGESVAVPADVAELFAELAPSATRAPHGRACSGRLLSASTSAQSIELALLAVERLLGAKLAAQAARHIGASWQPSLAQPELVAIPVIEHKP